MSVIDDLIYDRVDSDVGTTDKGEYLAADLNRVGSAVTLIAAALAEVGIVVETSPKTDWALGDEPTPAQLTQYINDIAAIRAALTYPAAEPDAPTDYNTLGVSEANAIEKILADCDAMITRMQHTVNLGWALGIADIGRYGGIA